jgi:hypothetical protein
MHITVQGVSRLPDPIEQRLPNLLEAVKGELADVDTFDATLAEPVVGYGGVVCDESPKQRFEAIRDATRQDSLAWCHCLVRGVGWLSNALDEDDQQEDDDG